MVCMQTVDYNREEPQHFKVNSKCGASDPCKNSREKIRLLCNEGDHELVICMTCCMESDCGTNYNIVNDLNFAFEYTASGPMTESMVSLKTDESDKVTQMLTRELRPMLRGLPGGFDIFFIRYEPRDEKTHRVITSIVVSAMKWEPDSNVQNYIEDALMSTTKGSNLKNIAILDHETSVTWITDVQCPVDTTNERDIQITWTKEAAGMTARQFCFKEFNTDMYAERKCKKDGNWGVVNNKRCYENQVNEDEVITKERPLRISKAVKQFFEKRMKDRKDISLTEMRKKTAILTKLTAKTPLSVAGVAANVLSSISCMLDCNRDSLKTPAKFRSMLYAVAEHVPVKTGFPFQFESKNVAFHCSLTSEHEIRDITVIEVTTSKSIKLNIVFGDKSKGLAKNGFARLDVPMRAVVKSLKKGESQKLSRVCFWEVTHDDFYHKGSLKAKFFKELAEKFTQVKSSVTGIVNARIISAHFPGVVVKSLYRNATLTYRHYSQDYNNPKCVYWNEDAVGEVGWKQNGCVVANTTKNETICSCNHLTSFTLFIASGCGLFSKSWFIIYVAGFAAFINIRGLKTFQCVD